MTKSKIKHRKAKKIYYSRIAVLFLTICILTYAVVFSLSIKPPKIVLGNSEYYLLTFAPQSSLSKAESEQEYYMQRKLPTIIYQSESGFLLAYLSFSTYSKMIEEQQLKKQQGRLLNAYFISSGTIKTESLKDIEKNRQLVEFFKYPQRLAEKAEKIAVQLDKKTMTNDLGLLYVRQINAEFLTMLNSFEDFSEPIFSQFNQVYEELNTEIIELDVENITDASVSLNLLTLIFRIRYTLLLQEMKALL